jgi:uncharacterized protein (TIGR03067 family)
MKTLGLGSFTFAWLVVLSVYAGDDAALKKERAALQGVWKIIELETPKGKEDDIVGATLEFDKDGKNITFTKGTETKKGTYKINPAGKPKEIDFMPADENKTMEGIYQIEKSKLKLCLCPDGSDGRPGEFAVKEGKRFVLITLEQAK